MKQVKFTAMAAIGLLFLCVPVRSQEFSSKSGYAPVNELKMYYEVHGKGEPLVLLHGSFMTIDMTYGQLIPELAKNHMVIAVELQGHGHTADIDRDFTYENFAKDVLVLLDYLKIEEADVIGYSLGATIALKMAVLRPDMVGKVVFISSVFSDEGWIPQAREQLANLKPAYLTNSPLKTAYDAVAPHPEHWTDFLTKMIAFEIRPFDVGLDKIKRLTSPILIINGDYDGVDLRHSQVLFKAMGGGGMGIMEPLSASRLAIIPGTTHVTLMMQTDKLLDLIKPFLLAPPHDGSKTIQQTH